MESVDFVGAGAAPSVSVGNLSSGSTHITSGISIGTISNITNGTGIVLDYLPTGGSANLLLKKDIDNPYTPHDSGHSSIESGEHQSSSGCSSSCRNCGRIVESSESGTQYETIKLDELFTHVAPSSPSSTASPTPSSASTSLRKSILQNGLCSNCIQSTKKARLIDSCSNSPSRTSSIESPSSGIGVASSVILKTEPSSIHQTQIVMHPEETFDNNQLGHHNLREIMSLIPHNSTGPGSIIATNTSLIPTIPSTTIVNPETNTKMEVKIEEVIPIPAELAMAMMKNMAATSIPTVVTSSHFDGAYQIVSDQGHYVVSAAGTEHAFAYQHEIVVGGSDHHHPHVILNSDGNPSIIYSTSALPATASYSLPTAPIPSTIEQPPTTLQAKKVSTSKRSSSSAGRNPNKVFSTVESMLECIDQVCEQARKYSEDQTSLPDNGEIEQDFSSMAPVKVEVTEQKYCIPTTFINATVFGSGPMIAPTRTIKYNGPSSSSSSYRVTATKSTPLVLAKKSAPPKPPVINLDLPIMEAGNSNPNYYWEQTGVTGDRNVACSGCKKTFKNKRLCKAHYQRVHEKLKRFTCHTCGIKFVYKGSLDSHLATHKPVAKYKCNACGQAFKDKSNLNQHIRTQHQQNFRKFRCEFCPSSFSKRVNARYHMKRKHPDLYPTSNMYLSTYGANANNPANSQQQQQGTMIPQHVPTSSGIGGPNGGGGSGLMYGIHQSTTTNLPSYSSQDYANSSSIIVSSQQQSTQAIATVGVGYPSTSTESDKKGEGNFKCEYCGRGFLFKNNLKAHLRTHTRDKKYVCTLCDKGFIYKESLKNHMLLHSNSFPYTCEICHKSFRDRSNRRKHVKNVHKNLLVNGEIPSSYQGTNPSAPGIPGQKKARTRKPKKAQSATTDFGNTPETPSTSSTMKKNTKKSGKGQGNKNLTVEGTTNNNNQSVIVSTNASSSTDLDRGVIMSSSQQMKMEYNAFASSDLPVTVHIPTVGQTVNIPINHSQQQQFSRNVIVKAEPGGTSTDQTSRLPAEQSIYLNPGATPMQQNVIVYPKPKANILESYSTEVNQTVIAQNLQQYYTPQTAQSYDATNIAGGGNGNTYVQHLIQTRLSPEGTTSTPPPQQQPQQFDTNAYMPSTNRGRSNSLTGTSTIINSETNESGGSILQQYATSISAPPVYSSAGQQQQQQQTGAANNNQAQYQFWPQIQPSAGNHVNTAQQQQQQTFYNPSQTIISTTSPQLQLVEGTQIVAPAPNVITVPYSTSEVLVTTDQSSSNNYYKDFDFSYFTNPPNT